MCTTVNKNKLLGPRRIKHIHTNSITNSYYEILKTSNGLVNQLLLREEPMEISQNQIDLKVCIQGVETKFTTEKERPSVTHFSSHQLMAIRKGCQAI